MAKGDIGKMANMGNIDSMMPGMGGVERKISNYFMGALFASMRRTCNCDTCRYMRKIAEVYENEAKDAIEEEEKAEKSE